MEWSRGGVWPDQGIRDDREETHLGKLCQGNNQILMLLVWCIFEKFLLTRVNGFTQPFIHSSRTSTPYTFSTVSPWIRKQSSSVKTPEARSWFVYRGTDFGPMTAPGREFSSM
jgi:hypothetical protein